MTLPYASLEDTLFKIAEALRVPVLVLALLCLALVALELGRFVVELVRRRQRDFALLAAATDGAVAALRERRDQVAASAWLAQISASTSMLEALERLVGQWGGPDPAEQAAKTLADFDFGSMRKLERTRALVRLGPALGLMGTLIPLSPALAGLADGDVEQLSSNLRVAFSVTVIGLLIGAVAFVISLVRDRLYGQDLSDLEFVAGRLLGAQP
ncbi:MAG: MotA/TolQ/ExbB proton channel family protein [Solirubrobacterales bacterium]